MRRLLRKFSAKVDAELLQVGDFEMLLTRLIFYNFSPSLPLSLASSTPNRHLAQIPHRQQ